jgi:uncharacterized membrane protein YoaK (UPF0700 family)
LSTINDEHVIQLDVSINAFEHPELFEEIKSFTNQQQRSRQLKDLATISITDITNTNDHVRDKKRESKDINLTSIIKFMFGVISGTGIASAFLITPLFFILFAVGLLGYALTIENERVKKNRQHKRGRFF